MSSSLTPLKILRAIRSNSLARLVIAFFYRYLLSLKNAYHGLDWYEALSKIKWHLSVSKLRYERISRASDTRNYWFQDKSIIANIRMPREEEEEHASVVDWLLILCRFERNNFGLKQFPVNPERFLMNKIFYRKTRE